MFCPSEYVLLNLLCVWILFQNASSHSCFRFCIFPPFCLKTCFVQTKAGPWIHLNLLEYLSSGVPHLLVTTTKQPVVWSMFQLQLQDTALLAEIQAQQKKAGFGSPEFWTPCAKNRNLRSDIWEDTWQGRKEGKQWDEKGKKEWRHCAHQERHDWRSQAFLENNAAHGLWWMETQILSYFGSGIHTYGPSLVSICCFVSERCDVWQPRLGNAIHFLPVFLDPEKNLRDRKIDLLLDGQRITVIFSQHYSCSILHHMCGMCLSVTTDGTRASGCNENFFFSSVPLPPTPPLPAFTWICTFNPLPSPTHTLPLSATSVGNGAVFILFQSGCLFSFYKRMCWKKMWTLYLQFLFEIV